MHERFRIVDQAGLASDGAGSEDGENGAPQGRSGKRGGEKCAERHADQSCGEANQVADDRQKAREKHAAHGIFGQPTLGQFKPFRGKQQPLSVTQQDGAAQRPREPVAESRTKRRAETAGQDHAEQRHLPLRSPIAGGWHDDLRGHRDNRAFERHHQKYSHVAHVAGPFKPGFDELMKHLCRGARRSAESNSHEYTVVAEPRTCYLPTVRLLADGLEVPKIKRSPISIP